MNRIALLLGLSGLLYSVGCTSKGEQKEEKASFTVTSPLQADTSFTKEYVAQVQSVRNIELRAQEKGYLQNIYVDEGQSVKAGQLLFRIMPSVFEAECLKAQAVVKEAELDMLNAKTLSEKNIISASELAIKQARLDEARADLALAKLHLSFTEIRAPFDGSIDRIRFKAGSLIDEGSLLTTLSDNSSVFAYFNLTENEYLNFKSRSDSSRKEPVGLLMANGKLHAYQGLVETIESEFDNETGNIAFRARFPNPGLLLKHGETGKVQMTVRLNHALIIPQKATYEIQDKQYVFVVDKNNTVRSRNIIVKQRLPDIYVVDAGLSKDDRILLEGVQNVKDDEKIQYKYIEPEKVISNLQLIRQ